MSSTTSERRAVAKSLVANPTDPRYLCTQHIDCTVKNKGNCCGYYPVCANVYAVFTQEDACPGGTGFSICGFPVIDHCQCVSGECTAFYPIESPYMRVPEFKHEI